MTSLFVAVALGSLLLPAPADNPLTANLAEMYTTISGDLAAAARKMPADQYEFRPAPEVRSFGQIIGHLVGSQFIYCAQARGIGIGAMDKALLRRLGPIRTYSEAPIAERPDPPSKDTLVALLDEGVAFCKEAYGSIEDAAVAEAIGKPGHQSIRFRPLMDNVAHSNLHYGNVVTYLRLKGLVPPSTERVTGTK